MNISSELIISNIKYDRYLNDTLTLPFQLNDILFQPNDTVSCNLVNIKLKHLYDNFLYLYKNTLISSNVLPVTSTAIAGISAGATNFTWYKGLSTSQFIPISTNNLFPNVDNTNLSYILSNPSKECYYMFLSYKNEIKVFKFNKNASYFENVYSINEIDPGNKSYTSPNTYVGDGYDVLYYNITAFAAIDNYFFILDAERNQLVKYDATGFVKTNNILNERLVFVNTIGNYGSKESKVEFNSPTGLASYNKFLYVLDAGNSCVKKFDIDLNWKYTYRLSKDLLNLKPIDISCDIEGNIYILTDKKLFKYNNTFTTKEAFELNTINGDIFKKIIMSQAESNVFFLLTNKNVLKRFTSNPGIDIGKYLLFLFNYDLENDINNALSLYKDNNNDLVFLFSKNNNTGKIGFFIDNINLYDILAQRDFDIYSLKDTTINGDEYLQSWVINKTISKILINHMRFRDQIIGKFIARQDEKGNVVFDNTRYLLINELDSINFQQTLSNYIGANELVTSGVLNRCIRNIYNIQANLLNILKSEILNFPTLDIPITLN